MPPWRKETQRVLSCFRDVCISKSPTNGCIHAQIKDVKSYVSKYIHVNMAEALSMDAKKTNLDASLRRSASADEIISPLEELAYVKSHRMRRVRWSEDLEEIRYFNVKSKKEKRRASDDSTCAENGTTYHRRRFSEDTIQSPIERFRNWLEDKDFKSDVILLGLKMKSAFKKADFYDAEKKWEAVFEEDVQTTAVNGIGYKR